MRHLIQHRFSLREWPWQFFFWTACTVLSVIGSAGFLNEFPTLGWLSNAVISILVLRLSRFLPPLTLVLLFNFLFCLYLIPNFFFEVDIVTLNIGEGLPYLSQSLWVISLFLSTLALWISGLNKSASQVAPYPDLMSKIDFPKSDGIFYILMALLFLVTLFGIRGNIVLGADDGYQKYIDNLQNASGLQEYMLVPFFVSAFFIRSRIQKIIWFAVLFIFISKLTLIGLRIVALMGMVMAVWIYGLRINFRTLVLSFIFGYIFVSFLGLLKGGVSSEDIAGSLIFEMHGDTVVSHHSNVMWASSVMLKLIDENVIDFSRRLDLFIYYLGNTIIPSSILQSAFDQPYMGTWLQDSGQSSGGGHAAVYAFVAGGACGVIGLASILGWAVRRSVSAKRDVVSQYTRCWLMLVLITFPRWISYDIGNFFFRLPIYAVLMFGFIKTMEYSVRMLKARRHEIVANR